jgi:hypothetical protein
MLERRLQIRIFPVWTPRDQPRLQWADSGSKFSRSTDEWAVHRPDLAVVFGKFGFLPDVDCFASALNTVCPVYFSVIPQLDSAGVDFFAQTLVPGLNYYCCPPVKCLPAA